MLSYGYPHMISIYGNPYMDIHIWISIYGYPYTGSQGSLGGIHGYLGGTDGTWASRTPDTSSEDTSSELFIDTRPGPPDPTWTGLAGPIAGCGARGRLPGSRASFRF